MLTLKKPVTKTIFLYFFLLTLFFSFALILFRKSFSVFFFQDDFFLFSISRFKSLTDFFHAFIPRTDAIHYCPLSQELFYAIFYAIFKFNTGYYHVTQFVIHAINGLLIFILIYQLLRDRRIAFLAALLFTVSWTHLYELTWVGATFNSIGLFFILSYLLVSTKPAGGGRQFLEIVFLIAALLSLETAVIAPLLLGLIFIHEGKLKKNTGKKIILHLIIVAMYIFMRFLVFRIPATNSYQIGISRQTIKNLIIFFLWLFNFPEASIVHLHPNGYLITIVDSWFAETFPLFSIFLTTSLFFWGLYFLYLIIFNYKIMKKILLFGAAWFMIAILPIIVIPRRIYPYYPIVAQIGLWIIFAAGIKRVKFRMLSIMALLIFLIGNLLAVNFNEQNHWIFASSAMAKSYYEKYLKVQSVIRKAPEIYWRIDDSIAKNALINGLGFNVFSNNYQQKFYLQENEIPAARKLQVFDINLYLLSERGKRLRKFYELKIATPAAALDLWY